MMRRTPWLLPSATPIPATGQLPWLEEDINNVRIHQWKNRFEINGLDRD